MVSGFVIRLIPVTCPGKEDLHFGFRGRKVYREPPEQIPVPVPEGTCSVTVPEIVVTSDDESLLFTTL